MSPRPKLHLALGAVVLGLLSGSSVAQSLRAIDALALIVTQTASGTGNGVASVLDARVGRPSTVHGSSAVTLGLPSTPRLAASLGLNGIPVQDYGVAVSVRSAIEQRAAAAIAAARSDLDRQLDAAMAATGASCAYFTLLQTVEAAGAGRPMWLTWSLLRLRDSPSTAPPPQVRTLQPRYVHVQYTPLHASVDLPAGTTYQGAGKLVWTVVDAGFRTLQAEQTVDVGGAFDEPPAQAGVAITPDAGLACLVDHRDPACGHELVDVRTLMEQSAADGALVDYRRRLAPLRTLVDTAGAEPSWQIVMAVAVDRRLLARNGCGRDAVTYGNQGRRGFALLAVADRYLVTRSVGARLIGKSSSIETSQPESYDKRTTIAPDLAWTLGDRIINPIGEDLTLVAAADVPGLTRLATLEQVGNASNLLFSRRSAHSAILPDAEGRFEFAPWWNNTFTCGTDGLVHYLAQAGRVSPRTRDGQPPDRYADGLIGGPQAYERTLSWADFRLLCSRIGCPVPD